MLADLPPVPDTYWSIHDEDDYIGEMDALDIHIIYTAEINTAVINPGYSIHYDS